jgi:hypothetical protein
VCIEFLLFRPSLLTLNVAVNKKMRLKTLPYELTEKVKQENAKKQKLEKIERCASNAENYIDERKLLRGCQGSLILDKHVLINITRKGFWHVYRDCTHFEYQVQLKRNDEESGNVSERHLLTVSCYTFMLTSTDYLTHDN